MGGKKAVTLGLLAIHSRGHWLWSFTDQAPGQTLHVTVFDETVKCIHNVDLFNGSVEQWRSTCEAPDVDHLDSKVLILAI